MKALFHLINTKNPMPHKPRLVSCAELFQLIPSRLVKDLEEQTHVNHQVKKLTGEVMLKILLFSLLNSRHTSLRVMETLCNSLQFRVFLDKKYFTTTHTTLSDRIANVNYEFFEKIFTCLCEKGSKFIKTHSALRVAKYDSTLVGISAKLIRFGIQQDKASRLLKFTVGLKDGLPREVRFFSEQSGLSEEIALKETILGSKSNKNSIVLFDRGLQSRHTFSLFTHQGISFITRAKTRLNYKTIKIQAKVKGQKTETLSLQEDLVVKLKDENGKWTAKEFRLIIATTRNTQEQICFLTNITDLDATTITNLYRERWEIETFFKFLKQELNFSHLVSRTENGIKVMLYATLILALLILMYKHRNHITSYKIAKLRFAQELEMELIKHIVILCNGDISHFFGQKNLYPG